MECMPSVPISLPLVGFVVLPGEFSVSFLSQYSGRLVSFKCHHRILSMGSSLIVHESSKHIKSIFQRRHTIKVNVPSW
jgi:hypothetical protein